MGSSPVEYTRFRKCSICCARPDVCQKNGVKTYLSWWEVNCIALHLFVPYWQLFHFFPLYQNDDEDNPTGGRKKPTVVSIPNPLYSGSRAFAEPFGVRTSAIQICFVAKSLCWTWCFWGPVSMRSFQVVFENLVFCFFKGNDTFVHLHMWWREWNRQLWSFVFTSLA